MIHFTPGMDSAPTERDILALWASGEVAICRWDTDKYNRRGPKPYWSVPGQRGVAEQRANPPIAWCELVPAPTGATPSSCEALAVLRALVGDLDALMSESRGVDGLHANGEVAQWSELVAGGRFEEWLGSLSAARHLLDGGTVTPPATAQGDTSTSPVGVNSDRLVAAFFEGYKGE